MKVWVAIALGSAVGGLLRYLSTVVVVAGLGQSALWATALVNTLGSLLIGYFAAVAGPQGTRPVGATLYLGVTVGFIGGFTTFSILSLETLNLLIDGRAGLAAINIGGSLLLSLLAVWYGFRFGMR